MTTDDDFGKVQEALQFISADLPRDEWAQIGMSIKAALGPMGWSLFDEWSQNGASYKPDSAKSTWRSIKATGGIGPGTLFKYALDGGWNGKEPVYDEAKEAARRAARAAEERREAEAREKSRKLAADRAAWLIRHSKPGEHAYLSKKGFPKAHGLINILTADSWKKLGFYDNGPSHSRVLLVPMRDLQTNAPVSAQMIQTDGTKKFLAGGRARGSVLRMGRGAEKWLVEGYATGLSVMAALDLLYLKAEVFVCFSAANLYHVHEQLGGRRFVIGDNDADKPPKKDGTRVIGDGPMYAAKCGSPWWMPEKVGTDANDFHLDDGLPALADAMRDLRRVA